jgi:hypothetical protein
MVDRKVVPFDEFYYQLKLMYLFLLHVVCERGITQTIIIILLLRVTGRLSGTILSEDW